MAAVKDYLSWDGFTLSLPVYLPGNIQTLYSTAFRGSDRAVPGATGIRTNPRRPRWTEHTIEVVVFGVVDASGDPYSDPVEGAQQNLLLLANACAPITSGDGTRTVTWHRRGALANLTCDCIVGPLTVGADLGDAVVATVDLMVPAVNGTTWT